jgi:hypothetical protein
MSEEPESQIQFTGDQDDHESASPEYKDHLEKAFVHKAGLGPHPGKFQGQKHELRHGPAREERADPTEGDLARLIEEEHPGETQAQLAKREAEQPSPPEETIQQPPRGGGGGKEGAGKPPSKGTPAALGQEAVAPPSPEGEF